MLPTNVHYLETLPDCNTNGSSDIDDIDGVTGLDCNLTSVPDECETGLTRIAAGVTSSYYPCSDAMANLIE